MKKVIADEPVVTTGFTDKWLDLSSSTANIKEIFDIDTMIAGGMRFNADGIRINSNGNPYLFGSIDKKGGSIYFSPKLVEELLAAKGLKTNEELKGTKLPKSMAVIAVMVGTDGAEGLVFIRKGSNGEGSFE